jgi:DNA-binding MarR family transcriptional regulator
MRKQGLDAKTRTELAALTRNFSSATVLFHHAMAEHLGLGPTDHKCLGLLLQHEGLSGSRLAAMTGLTTGAITGVVNRLERAGYVKRLADPDDGRRQILRPVPERIAEVGAAFLEFGPDNDELVADMDAGQIGAVMTFLARANEQLEQRAAHIRAEARRRPTPTTDREDRR